ncbi:MAG: hypothetical protein JW741_06125 [Sedimentisphaerales bacterium]|nr:hypothetical protein [Sedimentisphaerales bacterium]
MVQVRENTHDVLTRHTATTTSVRPGPAVGMAAMFIVAVYMTEKKEAAP